MTIVRKDQSFPERPVIILLYGYAGVGKTSVGNTAKNPILLDCDRGADRSLLRPDTIVATTWNEVLTDEGFIKEYDTLEIDTAKAVLDDFLMTYVVTNDYKLRTNKLKAYGAIADEFKMFINRRRSETLDIVIIAHAKEEKDGDVVRITPDVTGGSKDLLLRIADQVGFMYMDNNQRTITFNPTDRTIGKNVARLPILTVPDETDPKFKTFMAEIIAQVKGSIQSLSEEQKALIEKIENVQELISQLQRPEDAQLVSKAIDQLPKAQQVAFRGSLRERLIEAGIRWDKTKKIFEYVSPSDSTGVVS
jgi:hypothetical protein